MGPSLHASIQRRKIGAHLERHARRRELLHRRTRRKITNSNAQNFVLGSGYQFHHTVNLANSGKGWDRHIIALRHMLRDGEETSAFFTNALYLKTRPKRLYTTTSGSKVPELGARMNNADALWVHYEPSAESCQFLVSNGDGKAAKFCLAVEETAQIVQSIISAKQTGAC